MFRVVAAVVISRHHWHRITHTYTLLCHCNGSNIDSMKTKNEKRTVSIRLECNYEDIDISRFQMWLPMLMLKLDLAFYILFSSLLSFFHSFYFNYGDMSPSDFWGKNSRKKPTTKNMKNVTFALLHWHKQTKNPVLPHFSIEDGKRKNLQMDTCVVSVSFSLLVRGVHRVCVGID